METPPERMARLQEEFAGHIRDPDRQRPPPDVEDRRMHIYRRLFFNNIDSLLANNFPVLRSIYDDAGWRGLVREFYAEHRCQTPLFPEVAKEFLRYLQDLRGVRDSDPPFMLELAHYEYAELALSVTEDEDDYSGIDVHGDLLAGVPVKSVLAWAFAYRFAVHRISPDFLPEAPAEQPVYLALYRDSEDRVGFLELNAVTAALLEEIEGNRELNGETLLRQLAEKINYPDADALVEHGGEALREMRQLGILAGTLKST